MIAYSSGQANARRRIVNRLASTSFVAWLPVLVASLILAPAALAAPSGPFLEVTPADDVSLQLRAGHHNAQTRVLPDPKVLHKTRLKTANFIVTYIDFTPQAQAAFQHAVDIWSQLITSTVPIRIQATWIPLEPGILGNSRANRFWTNGTNIFPDALADALNGSDLGGGDFDIIVNFNSNFSWYFGTDANPPVNTFDLVTVVLHELGHGLALTGLMTVENGQGFHIFEDPSIFASFTEDLAGNSITDEVMYPDGSIQLGDVLQGGDVYFAGTNAVSANGGTRPELYAPNPWEPGSSFSHLNETSFPPGNPHSLMTPFLDFAEAIHSPGDIILCMYQDLGWTSDSNCTGSSTPLLSDLADLIVPGYEVDVENPGGPTTFFAVRNTSDKRLDFDITYHPEAVTGTPYRTDIRALNGQRTMTVNVANDLTNLPSDNGRATGLILIKETGISSNILEGDYFRLDQANAFASGDRVVRPSDFCLQHEIRFVEFGSGSEFRILVNQPQGLSRRTFGFTAYDEQGNILNEGGYFTDEHLTVIDVSELGFNNSFGTVVFDFSNSSGGWVSAQYSAFGLFTVELNSACRDVQF